MGVGMGQHEGGTHAALGADGAEQVGPLAAQVLQGMWPAAALGPDMGGRALLPGAVKRLRPLTILDPDLIGVPALRTATGKAAVIGAANPL